MKNPDVRQGRLAVLWLILVVAAIRLGGSSAWAQPDYPLAHWTPPNCVKWYTSGNGHHFCVIHDMEGYYWTSISYLNRCDTGANGNYNVDASVNYLVNGLQNGSDSLGHRENNPGDPAAGDITQSVRESNYAWHAVCWNRWMFGTEHEGFVSNPTWYSEAMYQASAGLQRYLCDKYNIPKDRNHIIGHDEKKNASWVAWMQTNWPAINPSCNTHTDPGQYWDWNHFIALINTNTSAPPTITNQPQSVTVLAGQSATFSVAATGSNPLSFQWRFQGNNISGATTSTYTLASVQVADTGSYSVVVTNTAGNAVSSDALLTVLTLGGWGDNAFNQITLGSQVTNLIAVAAGGWHSLGLRPDGVILSWGNNYDLQCDVPSAVTDAIAIAAGGYHSLAIRANGTVAAWGNNEYGQSTPPVGLANVLAVSAGTWHSVALRRDGRVEVWGDNSWGQTNLPPGLTNVIAVAAGGHHCLALKASGTIVAWGDNTDSEGNFTGQSVVPDNFTKVIAIAAGEYHSLALKADGTVTAWGDNSQNQCAVPAGLGGVSAIAGGGAHSLALKSDGTVSSWGSALNGQCDAPATLSSVVGIGAGEYHSLLLMAGSLPVPRLLNPSLAGKRFSVIAQTLNRRSYALEFAASLAAPTWTPLATNAGNGGLRLLADPAPTGAQRLYRMRQW